MSASVSAPAKGDLPVGEHDSPRCLLGGEDALRADKYRAQALRWVGDPGDDQCGEAPVLEGAGQAEPVLGGEVGVGRAVGTTRAPR